MELLRFATAGSVDDGKSTLIGRLLYDSKQILNDQLEALRAASERRNGGALDLSSKPGEGTTAAIWIPCATDAAIAEDSEPRVPIRAVRNSTILLVDDEELVRIGTAEMLSDLGHEPARDEMVMLLVRDAAVRTDQLDPVLLDPINGADVDAVGADHFHMLADVLEAAHNRLLAGPTTQRFARAAGSAARRPTTPV